jgi:hypothetical protein
MTNAELVKRLLDAIQAGDTASAVGIALQAVDEAREEARPKRRHRKKVELVRAVK